MGVLHEPELEWRTVVCGKGMPYGEPSTCRCRTGLRR